MRPNAAIPEGQLYSIFDKVSDAVLILDADGSVLYQNEALKEVPSHLLERILTNCGPLKCTGMPGQNSALLEDANLEGWTVVCRPIAQSRLLLIKYDDHLRDRIQCLRKGFSNAIAKGTPAEIAGMQILRALLDNRWIAIGKLDPDKGCIRFHSAFDEEDFKPGIIPDFYLHETFNTLNSIALTSDPSDCFAKVSKLRAQEMNHVIGIPLHNHLEQCVGYALVADETPPDNLKYTLTLLQELAVLYGPYFEVGTAKRATSKAISDACTDVVTGAGNRRAFEIYVQDCLNKMHKEEQHWQKAMVFDPEAMRNSVLMLVDFDGFKRINDRLGHEEGDRALRLVAASMAECKICNSVFRIGGDELAQVFPRAGILEAETLRQLMNTIEQKVQAEGFDGIGLSMGAVQFFEGEGSLTSLVTLADARMYQDKRLRSIEFL